MRVLFVVSYYKPAFIYGGPVHSISSLCEALARQGIKVTVFTTNANGERQLEVPLGQAVNLNGVGVWYFPLNLRGVFFYSPLLGAACQDQIGRYDLVVIESVMGYALFPAARACLETHVPYVVPLRGQLLPWAIKQSYWKKKLYLSILANRYLNRAAALHCTDLAEAEAAKHLLQAPTFVIPNGIDLRKFDQLPPRGALRNRLGIPEKAKLLLFMGRLHSKKRPDIAVASLVATQILLEEVHLIVAGPDETGMATSLYSQAKRWECADKLHLVGLLRGDDLLQAYADADLLIMPSAPESENFGMSALEAMAAELPILVSEGVPVGRWAVDASAGKVIPCKPDAFGQVTLDLLSQPRLLRRMAKNGRALARETFNIDIVAEKMSQQYQLIIDENRTAHR